VDRITLEHLDRLDLLRLHFHFTHPHRGYTTHYPAISPEDRSGVGFLGAL
jgi:hypothetical protein